MAAEYKVFTPLRLSLMIAIVVANLLAIFTLSVEQTPQIEALSVFAVVFIMLFVFVILLELVWMHQRSKPITEQAVLNRYRLAKILYAIMFVAGFLISYFVLTA